MYGNNNPALQLLVNKDEVYELIYSEKYTEKISRILFYAKLLYNVFSHIESYLFEENEDKQAIYKMYVRDFVPKRVSFEVDLKDKAYLQWNFNSLKSAIEVIIALNATNDRKEIKMCKRCGKPFMAKNPKAEYCSASCRNVANVYKNRAKNK